MSYRVVPHAKALGQLGGFPAAALDALIEVLAYVADDPYDPLRTVPTDDPNERRAVFGDGLGLVTFWIRDADEIVVVHDVTWAG